VDSGDRSGTAPALQVRNLHKSFGGTHALRGVSFDAAPGRIHALLGGNGSGKSTLIKILAGVHAADSGEVHVGERTFDASSITPALARTSGLHFVHQQAATFPDLTVAENLAIGRGFETAAGGRIRWSAVEQRARDVLERFDIAVKPRDQLGALAPATQTMVAIARALQDQENASGGVLVLDEPTASLPIHEVELLLSALRRYADAGQTILYVTHRLEEVLDVGDVATVLRDGSVVDTVSCQGLKHERLVELILGRSVERLVARPPRAVTGAPIVEAVNIGGGAVNDASFRVGKGEIVGIAGLLGSGRSSLLRLLFGAVSLRQGEITFEGSAAHFRSPADGMQAGVAYVPEDRAAEAAFADLDVNENLCLATSGEFFHGGRVRHAAERKVSQQLMSNYLIKAESDRAPLSSLSGGNQQKVVLARWLRRNPRLLLLDEPTQGVDIGARLEIWEIVRVAVDGGMGVVVVSSDLEELSRVCDRVLIMKQGCLIGEVKGDAMGQEELERMMLSAIAS
jgi:ribose transport system ATP-binding protein